ncbi:11S globulin-like [Euphorbia lathyris]|uniref:11S globulin-like n=1 Tax=Euphorbia lathyris TaxID=212925 RepID=UPI0033131DCA
MNKSFLLTLSLCCLVLFQGCLARFNLEQRNECQLERLSALEPDTKIQCEAGYIESWNPNHDQFQCTGVAVVRRTIEPKGLLLPHYSNAPQLMYIVQGRGMTGALFSGCPETFQESQQSRGSQDQDQHQKIRHFRRGDVIAFPAGVAHWCYNDGNENVVMVNVLDTTNIGNQLDTNPRHFYLAGNPEDEFKQLSERPREGRQQPFTRRHSQGSCNNIFCGLSSSLIAEAFNINQDLARKLQSENDFRGSIVRVEGELSVVRPPRTQQEMSAQQEQSCRRRGGSCDNGAEETFCTMRMKENIADPSRADIFIPEVGRISTVNSHNLPILGFIKLSASHVVLRNDAVRLPHWHMNAHSIIYCLEGQATIQVSDENGNRVFDGTLREGQVLAVPQNFVMVKRAECDRFEYVAFNTNENAMTSDLAGRTSAFRAMPAEVIANAFQISREDAMRLKFGREETTLAMSKSRSGRRADA